MIDQEKYKKICDLAVYEVESMDMETLEHSLTIWLIDYYSSEDGQEDFDTNYAEMKRVTGEYEGEE